ISGRKCARITDRAQPTEWFTQPPRLRSATLVYETFAWCEKGPDCGKWYEGVEWRVFRNRNSEALVWGGPPREYVSPDSIRVTDWDVESPSAEFLAAFYLFIKKKGFVPCKT